MDGSGVVKHHRVSGRPGPADRPPLPAGHPLSWELITNGTVLERSAYPFPVFDLDGTECGR